jgi:hypothetical protein
MTMAWSAMLRDDRARSAGGGMRWRRRRTVRLECGSVRPPSGLIRTQLRARGLRADPLTVSTSNKSGAQAIEKMLHQVRHAHHDDG